MWIRLTLVLIGIVIMITGCNSLISQNFGTHKLRKVSLNTVVDNGLGDADFIEFSDATLEKTHIVGKALRDSDEDYHLHPILTSEQAAAYQRGENVTVNVVGWYKLPYTDCVNNGDCMPKDAIITGLVTIPTDKKNPIADWKQHNLQLAPDVYYLQLWKEPMAWYWNLLMFLGGLSLAIGIEAIWNKKKQAR